MSEDRRMVVYLGVCLALVLFAWVCDINRPHA